MKVIPSSIELQDLSVDLLEAPLFIAWQLTSFCNLNCLHCCEESGDALSDEMGKEEIFNFCQQIVDSKIPYVAISGGEPMLHPEFFSICEFLRAQGIDLKIETNGLHIDQEAAARFANLGLRSVQISVDGAFPETHLKLRGDSDWDETIQACRYLIEKGVNTEIVFVPTKFNYQEIGAVIDLAAQLGIYGVYTGKIMRIGRAALNWELLNPNPEEYQEFFKVLEKKTKEYEGRMKVYYYPYDVVEELKYRLNFPSASMLIVPNGKVKLIGPLPFICGDLKINSLKEIWQKYKDAWKNPQVIEFANQVITDPKLLAKSNNWIELY